MRRSRIVWIVGAVILLAIVVRQYHLTARSIWFDEAFTWRLIQFGWPEMIMRDAADVHPPLYYIVLKGWSVVFGSSLLALRMLSVLLGGATAGLAYVFTSYASRSREAGLAASVLIALSGFQIQFSWEARMYTLGTALVFLSSWLLLKAVRSRREGLWWWLAYAAAAAAAAYTHYYLLFSLAAQALFVLGYVAIQTRGRIGEMLQWRLVWYAVVSAVAAIALFAPWLGIFLRQNAQVQNVFWIPPVTRWSIPDTFYRILIPTTESLTHTGVGLLVTLAPALVIVASWIALVYPRRAARAVDGAWLVVLLAAVPFAISAVLSLLGQSLYQDRFFVFAQLYVTVGLVMVVARIPWRYVRYGLYGAATAGSLLAFVNFWQQLDIQAHPGLQAAAAHVYGRRTTGEPVLVSSSFIYFGVLHYAAEAHDALDEPKLYSESGQLVHFAGGPVLTASDIAGPRVLTSGDHTSLWVVDTTGFGSSPLDLPPPWQVRDTARFDEVFDYQGEIIVTRYTR